jgi:hypothetical protein
MSRRSTKQSASSKVLGLFAATVLISLALTLVQASESRAATHAFLGKQVASTERWANPAPRYNTYCRWTPGAVYGFLIATPYGYACTGYQTSGSGNPAYVAGLKHRVGVWNNSLGLFLPQSTWRTGAPRI